MTSAPDGTGDNDDVHFNRGKVMRMIGTRTVLGCVLAMAAGCAMANEPAEAAPATADEDSTRVVAPHRCNYAAPPFLTMDVEDFTEACLAPRGHDDDFVRIPKSAADFASRCAVTLIDENIDYVDEGHDCYPNDPHWQRPFVDGDRVMITDWGHGKYTLTRMRGSDSTVIPLVAGDSNGGGTPYLMGSLGNITYFVYLQYEKVTKGRFDKRYRFEVFERDVAAPAQCELHKPTRSAKLVPCDPVSAEGSETGTSTGGEPPPK